jgi:ABC-type sugar transport system substrate-binding protein
MKGALTRALGLLAVAALLLAACGGDDDEGGSTASGGGGGDSAKKVSVAHFVAIQANPLEQVVISESKKTAAANNATVTIFDSNNDVQREINNCNDAIASQKYDAFVLKAVSGPPLMSCARQAIDAGIPVVVQGTALGPEQTTEPQVDGIVGSVVTLSTTNGTQLADETDAACKELGKTDACKVVYLFGPTTFDYAAIVRKTYMSVLKEKYPYIEIVGQEAANFDADQAATKVRQLLQVHKDTNVVANDCDPCSIASAKVVEDIGKKGDILLVSSGGQGAAVDAIKAGDLFATAVIMPKSESRTAVEMAIKAARKEKIDDTSVDASKDLGPSGGVITEENAADFQAEW